MSPTISIYKWLQCVLLPSGNTLGVNTGGAAVQGIMDEEITLHTEYTAARWTGEHTFLFQLPLAGVAEPLSLVLLQWTLQEGFHGKEVVEGPCQVRGRD